MIRIFTKSCSTKSLKGLPQHLHEFFTVIMWNKKIPPVVAGRFPIDRFAQNIISTHLYGGFGVMRKIASTLLALAFLSIAGCGCLETTPDECPLGPAATPCLTMTNPRGIAGFSAQATITRRPHCHSKLRRQRAMPLSRQRLTKYPVKPRSKQQRDKVLQTRYANSGSICVVQDATTTSHFSALESNFFMILFIMILCIIRKDNRATSP